MIKLKDLTETIQDNTVDRLFRESYPDILTLSEQDKANLQQLYKLRDAKFNDFNKMIDNRFLADIELKENLKISIEEYVETLTGIDAYFHEKLYKSGVADGVAFLLSVIQK